jgi:hypothetical protein
MARGPFVAVRVHVEFEETSLFLGLILQNRRGSSQASVSPRVPIYMLERGFLLVLTLHMSSVLAASTSLSRIQEFVRRDTREE